MNQNHLAWGLAICLFFLFFNSKLGNDGTKNDFNTERNTQQDPMQNKEAYVSILYGNTPRDYEYFLGVRVMWQSLRESNTTRDMITLVSSSLLIEMKQEWERETNPT